MGILKYLKNGLKSVVIPSSVTSIQKEAFSGCKSLQEIVIPNGVTSILAHAFKGCSSLEIVRLPVGVSKFDTDYPAFEGCVNLKSIYVPKDSVEYYKELFPSDMHWLIVEDGSDFSVKSENFIAKDLSFTETLRVIVPKGRPTATFCQQLRRNWENGKRMKSLSGLLATLNPALIQKRHTTQQRMRSDLSF